MLRSTRERAKSRNTHSVKKLGYDITLSFIKGVIFIGLSFLAAILFDYSLLAIVSLVIGLVWSLVTIIWYFKHKNNESDYNNELFDSPVQPKSDLQLRQAKKAQQLLENKRLQHGDTLFLTDLFEEQKKSDPNSTEKSSLIISSISETDRIQYVNSAKKPKNPKKISKKSRIKKQSK